MRRALISIIALMASPAMAETRCGWLDNPTPANYWLTDARGEWTVMTQGSGGTNGFIDLPAEDFDFGEEWVETNGHYGYGCACIKGDFGPIGSSEVIRVMSMKPLPLAKCRADGALPRR
jgi:hypothetical protein